MTRKTKILSSLSLSRNQNHTFPHHFFTYHHPYSTTSSAATNFSQSNNNPTPSHNEKSPPVRLFKESLLRDRISINPVYRSWLKSPQIRSKELRKRREMKRQEFESMQGSELEKFLLEKYEKLYLRPSNGNGEQTISMTELLLHRNIPDHLACTSFDYEHKKKMSYSYSQLNSYSNYLAQFLRMKGLKKGDAIGVMMNEDIQLSVVMMACMRSGFIYVPLDAKNMKMSQLDYRLRDADCKWIISHIDFHDTAQVLQEQLSDDVRLLNWTEFGVETPRDVREYAVEGKEYFLHENVNLPLLQQTEYSSYTRAESGIPVPEREMDVPVSPDDTLCLLYTVNAMGKQQAFPLPYRALASIHAYMEVAIFVEEEERMWASQSAHSPYGVMYNIIGHLLVGSQSVFLNGPSNNGAFHMAGVRTLEIEHLVVTEGFLEGLMKASESRNASFMKSSHLRKITYTGSKFNNALIEPFEQLWECKFYNHYGTAEDGMIINDAHLPMFESLSKKNSLGRPQIGYRVVLLDDDHEEISDMDHLGQIAVDVEASPLYWFRSYHNNEEATKRKFTVSPSTGKKYALTGDYAKRIDEQDHFEYVGRMVSVLVNMGKKVNVEHVEKVMRSHPGISDCLVIGIPFKKGSTLMCVAIRQDSGVTPTKQDIQMESELILEWAKEKAPLEEHERPQQFMFVDKFPSTGADREQMRKVMREGFSL